MPVGPVSRSWGGSPDRRALVTERGVNEGIGCTLVAANFTGKAGVGADGSIPALYPIVVAAATGLASPFAGTANSPLSGFTLNPANISQGNEPVAYMSRGDIDPSLLPTSTFVLANVLAADAARFKFDAKA